MSDRKKFGSDEQMSTRKNEVTHISIDEGLRLYRIQGSTKN